MSKAIVALLVLAVAACSTTPAKLRAGGKHFVTRTNQPPAAAARCLLTRMEAESSSWRGRVMPLEGGKYELLIWTLNDAFFWIGNDSRLLAEIWPAGGGVTRIDAWFAWDMLDVDVDGGQVLQRYLKGC